MSLALNPVLFYSVIETTIVEAVMLSPNILFSIDSRVQHRFPFHP